VDWGGRVFLVFLGVEWPDAFVGWLGGETK
jgi:hypothetical protein